MWELNGLVRLDPSMIDKLETFQMDDLKKKQIVISIKLYWAKNNLPELEVISIFVAF